MSKYNCKQVVDYCSVAVSSRVWNKEPTGTSVLNEQVWSGPWTKNLLGTSALAIAESGCLAPKQSKAGPKDVSECKGYFFF